MKYRIVFFGSSSFSVPSLRVIHSTQNVLCVISHKRKHHKTRFIAEDSLKECAESLSISYEEKTHLTDSVVQFLKQLNADFFIVVSSSFLLNDKILSIPRYGCYNLHPSLLPIWRGASPIQMTLLCNYRYTGVCIFRMVKKLDAGPLLLSRKIPVHACDNYDSLLEKLSHYGSLLWNNFFTMFPHIIAYPQKGIPLYAKKIRKSQGCILWHHYSALFIHNMVRGLSTYCGVYFYLYHNNSRIMIKVYESIIIYNTLWDEYPKGYVCDDMGTIKTVSGCLRIISLQREGKRRMSFQEFNCSLHIRKGHIINKEGFLT